MTFPARPRPLARLLPGLGRRRPPAVQTTSIVSREIGPERAGEFVAKGHRLRHFFPHRTHFLPRPGPDGYLLANRMCGERDPAALWEIVVYADESLLDEFPRELFFDPEIVWHQQHFGRPGQVAAADVVVRGSSVWTMAHQSDLVQRIARRREHKTRIEKRFAGWHDMLLNAALAFAADRGARRLYVPTSGLATAHTDTERAVAPELFERVYDRDVERLYRASREQDWWLVDVAANRDRLVVPERRREPVTAEKTICVCHDVEAGLGHVGIDDELVLHADRTWRSSVEAMRRTERLFGVRATYNAVGRLLPELRAELEEDGHCIAFHSYDHRLPGGGEPRDSEAVDQLRECRRIDRRIKGYRPPRSRITPDIADRRLLERNFEWLASSTSSLGVREPVLRTGLVRIPIAFDDFPLYTGRLGRDAWERKLLELVDAADVVAFSLHDCYAHLWLESYAELLGRLASLGTFKTLDEVAAEVTLAAGV